MRLILNKKTFSIINNLIDKCYINSIESVKEKYRPKLVKYVKLDKKYRESINNGNYTIEFKNSPTKRKIIEYFLVNTFKNEWVKYSLLIRKYKFNSSILKKMLALNILSEKIVQEDRFKVKFSEVNELSKLTKPQFLVKEKILKIWKENSIVLFEGVTSSGKTEVYSHP